MCFVQTCYRMFYYGQLVYEKSSCDSCAGFPPRVSWALGVHTHAQSRCGRSDLWSDPVSTSHAYQHQMNAASVQAWKDTHRSIVATVCHSFSSDLCSLWFLSVKTAATLPLARAVCRSLLVKIYTTFSRTATAIGLANVTTATTFVAAPWRTRY